MNRSLLPSLLPSPTQVFAHSALCPPARIAIAGDWHADTDYGVGAIEHAAKRDATVLLQLGDFGYNFTDHYLDALQDALDRCGIVLGFVDGNHENFDRLYRWPLEADGLRHLRDRIVHLPRGFRWQWAQTRCLALGGAYSIDRFLRTPGRSWWPQEWLTSEQARDAAAGGPVDVMFCHDCPAGITVPGAARDRFGFPAKELRRSELYRVRLRSVVEAVRPARLWHGHFHHRYQCLLAGDDYRTVVDGLGKNGNPIDNNMVVVNLAELGFHRLSTGGAAPTNVFGLDQPNRRWLTDTGDGARPEKLASELPTRLMAPANEGVVGVLCSLPRRPGAFGDSAMTSIDESLVELRCAVAIVRKDAVLLLHRRDRGDWVLPGGRPRPHESMGSCVRRETREETGLDIHPVGCALVLEVNDPVTYRRIVELVFFADQFDSTATLTGEPGRTPQWVGWEELKGVTLSPPIAGFLPDLTRRNGKHARYLGNLWRPGPGIR